MAANSTMTMVLSVPATQATAVRRRARLPVGSKNTGLPSMEGSHRRVRAFTDRPPAGGICAREPCAFQRQNAASPAEQRAWARRRLGVLAQRLTVRELDDVAAGIADRAEIAGRRRKFLRLPEQPPFPPAALGHPLDIVAGCHGEAVMRHIVFALLSLRSAAEQHEHERGTLARLRQPNRALFTFAVLLDDAEPAIAL